MSQQDANIADTLHQKVPLVIGVTGHRDLLDEELLLIRQRVHELFAFFAGEFPDLPWLVMTPLAEGAYRLVAEVARELQLPVVILLPMPRELYQSDFVGESRAEFDSMTELGEIVELPLVAGNSVEAVMAGGHGRDLQYAQLGAYLAAHSHILLALWDGKPSEGAGGTGHVVEFHQHDVIELIAEGQRRSPIDFAEDESDLVFHISCSRKESGAPAGGLHIGEAHWLTRDDVRPRTDDMPDRYRVVFGRMVEFNADLDRKQEPDEQFPLVSQDQYTTLGEAAKGIEVLYRRADFLARRYQKLSRTSQYVSYSVAVCAMLSFIIWADLPDQKLMIYPYLLFILLVMVVIYVERRGGWQRKYLDYRVLAEGLRVQFWWSVAGVVMENPSRFSHDRFLRQQDLELGWIRNVMRYAGQRADAHLGTEEHVDTGLVVREWVGDQTAYYAEKSQERYTNSKITSALILGTFGAGLTIALVLAVFQFQIVSPWSNILVALMGLFPFLAAVRQGYANRNADRELITQYGHQYRIFSSANRLLQSTRSVDDQRDILRALGESALDEHGQWLLCQRERAVAGQVLQGG